MNRFPFLRWLTCLAFVVAGSLAVSRAGDNAVVRPVPQASDAAAQMGAYLQAQKITHTIEVADPKAAGETQGPLAVKIYGDIDTAQQDTLCAQLTATAKKTHTEGSTALFYTLERASGGSTFQASSLPSGNAEVNFGRGKATPAGYKLKRTVKL